MTEQETVFTIKEIKCICGKPINVDVYEWESETGIPTECGFHYGCADPVFETECEYTYDDSIRIQSEINVWVEENLRKQ